MLRTGLEPGIQQESLPSGLTGQARGGKITNAAEAGSAVKEEATQACGSRWGSGQEGTLCRQSGKLSPVSAEGTGMRDSRWHSLQVGV